MSPLRHYVAASAKVFNIAVCLIVGRWARSRGRALQEDAGP